MHIDLQARRSGFSARPVQCDLALSFLMRLLATMLWAAAALAAAGGAEDLRRIRSLELDPERCYRVRDVFLEREDVKLYFTDGHVIFAKPVLGRTVAALFLATSQTDVGEVLVIPPTPAERRSLARFLDETILNEKFRNAMMFFTDDTPEVLEEAIRNSPAHSLDPGQGATIAPRWSVVLRNLIDTSASRVLLDIYSGRGLEDGFFAVAIRGRTLGRFDVVIDPTLPEQVVAGQLVRSAGQAYYEVWSRFEARSYRNGKRSPAAETARLENYRIDTRLSSDLHMSVRASATLVSSDSRPRALGFDLSDRLEVTAVRIGGQEVEFLQQRQPVPNRGRRSERAPVVVILPHRLSAGGRYPIEFDYRGKVVSNAGSGVYFVDNRRNWYPRLGFGKTSYELGFRYPQNLELVATGSLVEDRVGDGMRVSRFNSERRIRLAAFNLGNYASSRREVDGFRVEVRATKNVEQRLQPPRTPIVLPPTSARGRRRGRGDPPVLVVPSPPPENPAADIERIADDSADAFRYFMRRFGDPAMPVTVISPVPGDFGQGFPGLVYASTLSYFEKGDRVLKDLSPATQRFYADLMRPHEIAHQWWGNVVTSMLDKDAWIMEALATYSSLLWLEERRGVAERNLVLDEFRVNLLRRADGETLESSGPIVLGRRLRTSKLPEAYRVIVYEKGAWIMHMLRGVLGDESFFSMLRQLCERYQEVEVTTESFRLLVASFLPEGYQDPGLRDFFDQWVHGTGIPRLSVDWKQTSSGGRHRFRLRLHQSQVPDYFPVAVPIKVHTLPGRSLVRTVVAGTGDDAGFSVVLRNPASRVELDPQSWLLADKR